MISTKTAGSIYSPPHRHHPPSPLSLETIDLTLKNLQQEYFLENDSPLNLGAETPTSNASTSPGSPGFGTDFAVFKPSRPGSVKRSISSSSLSSLGKQCFLRRPSANKDCGICFDRAVEPNRMTCCGTIFCLEHITQWVFGANSNGRCPSCRIRLTSPRNSNPATPIIRTPASELPVPAPLPAKNMSAPQLENRLNTRHGNKSSIKGLLMKELKHLDKGKVLRSFLHTAASQDLISLLLAIMCFTLTVSVFLT